MENKEELLQKEEVELVEASEDEMGPEERTSEFGEPSEDEKLEEIKEEE